MSDHSAEALRPPPADLGDEAPPRGLLRGAALFLDFDGTLSPIQDDPDAVHLPKGGAAMLQILSDRLGGALALVSGRDARDLTERVPASLWRAGNHGGMVLRPGQTEPNEVPSPPEALSEAVRALGQREGLLVEEKAAVLAVHTRARPEREEAVLDALREIVGSQDGYKLQHGKRVIELKPLGVDKGVVIERLCAEPPFAGRTPVFLGDDTTDEDGFLVVHRLGGAAVKIGEGESAARYRLEGPDAVWAWLREALGEAG
jgi:trehalose 6-phosphate phosphatase